MGFLALGFGFLQMVLDTGQRKDWFGSNQIRLWAALCVIGLVGMVIRELTAKHPIVDLRVLKDRTFAAGTLVMTMLGFVLYASLMLLPIYLQTLLGYPALQSGLALSPRGIGALLMTPISGQLTNRMDPRKLLFVGVVTGGFTMFSLSHLNLNAGYWDIFWPQIIQGAAMAFLFVPLMATSMSGIAKEKMGNATSIYNLMRNIGGSFGIATMTTFLARRAAGTPEPAHQPCHSDGPAHAERVPRFAELVSCAWAIEQRRCRPQVIRGNLPDGPTTSRDAVVRRSVLDYGRDLLGHGSAAAAVAQRARPAPAYPVAPGCDESDIAELASERRGRTEPEPELVGAATFD